MNVPTRTAGLRGKNTGGKRNNQNRRGATNPLQDRAAKDLVRQTVWIALQDNSKLNELKRKGKDERRATPPRLFQCFQ